MARVVAKREAVVKLMECVVAKPETVVEFMIWAVAEPETVVKLMARVVAERETVMNSRGGRRRARDCRKTHGGVIAERQTVAKFMARSPQSLRLSEKS